MNKCCLKLYFDFWYLVADLFHNLKLELLFHFGVYTGEISQTLPHMEPITTISFTFSYTNIRINEHHYSACRSNQTTLKNAHVESFDQVLDEVWIWSADVKLKAEVTFASRSQTGKVTGALSYNDAASEGTRKNRREVSSVTAATNDELKTFQQPLRENFPWLRWDFSVLSFQSGQQLFCPSLASASDGKMETL